MISKTRHDDGGSGNRSFHEQNRTTHRFVKNREYKKDIQIQICNPKYKDTLMKSETQLDDGSSENTQF